MKKKNLIYSSLILVLILAVLLISVQFPKIFIKKQFSYRSFDLYSNTELALNHDSKNVLDSVLTNLKTSDFYRTEEQFELFFIHGTFYEQLIRFFGRKNMAFSKFDQHFYSATPDFSTSLLHRNNNEYEVLNLVQIISHEGVHSQMYKDYYKKGRMQTPSWINEGYCEYISNRAIREKPNYQLSTILDRLNNTEGSWVKTSYGHMTPRSYLRDRILIEYLIEVKKRTILEVISDQSLQQDSLLKEVNLFFNTTAPSFK